MIFKPDTLVRWHRKGFRLYWTWKSRSRNGGRPAIDPDARKLIRTMPRNNIGWGAPRIHGELPMLGIQISESTVAKYMIRRRSPPSQTWRTFLDNHVSDLVSVDFFTVPTATFRIFGRTFHAEQGSSFRNRTYPEPDAVGFAAMGALTPASPRRLRNRTSNLFRTAIAGVPVVLSWCAQKLMQTSIYWTNRFQGSSYRNRAAVYACWSYFEQLTASTTMLYFVQQYWCL